MKNVSSAKISVIEGLDDDGLLANVLYSKFSYTYEKMLLWSWSLYVGVPDIWRHDWDDVQGCAS